MKRIRERIETSTGVKWVSGASRKEVNEKKRMILEADVRQTKSTAPLFKDYADAYIARYKVNKISSNTLKGYYGYMNNHLNPAFGDWHLDEIKTNDVQDFMNRQAKAGAAKKSIEKMMQLFSQIMESAAEDEIIPRNPCRSKKLFNPATRQTKVLPYSPSVYRQFEKALPGLEKESDRLFVALCVYCGMRKGEILALRWEDIDLEAGFIHITRATEYAGKNIPGAKAPKTENGVRNVPILAQLRPYLADAAQRTGYIIRGARESAGDQPITHQIDYVMQKRISKHFEEAGIMEPFLSHRMRHTVLTLLNNSRLADDKSLQAWAGHNDAAFTRRQYMTAQDEQLHYVGDKFSDYLAAM